MTIPKKYQLNLQDTTGKKLRLNDGLLPIMSDLRAENLNRVLWAWKAWRKEVSTVLFVPHPSNYRQFSFFSFF